MAPDQNITAWFDDAARRHPDIRHSDADKRFYEEEWNLMMQNGRSLSAKSWVLLLEDYEERFHDPLADYVTITPELAFMVGRHVPQGKKAELQTTYEEARRIAKSIVAKLYRDCMDACDADVPEGVKPPVMVDLNSLRITRVELPLFDHAFGVRVTILIRTNDETTFTREEAAWLPLDTPAPVLDRWPLAPLVVDSFQFSWQQSYFEDTGALGVKVLVTGFANQDPDSSLWGRNTGNVVTKVAPGAGSENSAWEVTERVPGSIVVVGSSDEATIGAFIVCNETGSSDYSDNGGTGKVPVDLFEMLANWPNEQPRLATGPPFDEGITTDRAQRVDPYRRMVWQWTADESTWTDLDMEPVTEAQALAGVDLPTLPPEATAIRSKWTRGSHVQGYSATHLL